MWRLLDLREHRDGATLTSGDHGQRQSPGDVLVYVIDAQDNVTHGSGHNPDEINPDLRGNLTGGKKRRKSRKQHKLKKTKEIQKAP